ncbi:aminotransferase class III-fold pyridoxal phosphate-dependent enzyme [Variovorax ginsengisoli]|uniref:aminotransferase class III-fold pyridoxal phosphate-dependent enzyme n=1 Tax=Variovorax ginsengisoli TaxID=363844 RepID=UPI003F50E316
MFKLSHPIEAPLVADFRTQALLHVARSDPSLPVQRLLPDLHGVASVQIQDAEDRTRVARVFSYLEGMPTPQAPRSAAQRSIVASMLARLDRALAHLSHPAGEGELPWDIQRAERVRHNDFNLYNLLVDPDEPARVSGILDFGDMAHAPLVNDLAVAASYHIDEKGDALTTIARFAADCHSVLPLTEGETFVLLDLVRARPTTRPTSSATTPDTVFSSDDVLTAPACFLRAALDAIHAAGGVLIADEVQPGFGRTGGASGAPCAGVVPDVMTMGKPMRNVHPVAGLAVRPEVMRPSAKPAATSTPSAATRSRWPRPPPCWMCSSSSNRSATRWRSATTGAIAWPRWGSDTPLWARFAVPACSSTWNWWPTAPRAYQPRRRRRRSSTACACARCC